MKAVYKLEAFTISRHLINAQGKALCGAKIKGWKPTDYFDARDCARCAALGEHAQRGRKQEHNKFFHGS